MKYKYKYKYLSAEKQAILMPNHRGIKYHNATLNPHSRNRNWMIDISCFHNPNCDRPIRYEGNFVFTNKRKALEFIKQVNE